MRAFASRHIAITFAVIAFALPIAYGLTLDPIDISLRDGLRAPSTMHLLGTDQLGRDLLARIAHAFIVDLRLALICVTASLVLGVLFGVASAEFGRAIDSALVFAMDVLVALPQIVVAVVLAAYLGGGEVALIIALSLTGWVRYARITRAQTMQLRDAEFITVARVTGASRLRILRRHIVPNVVPPLASLVALQFGHTILNIAALGFLGLGVQPPTAEWGVMISEARPYLGRAPGLAIYPGLFLFGFTCICLALARTRRSTDPSGDAVAAA